jgi:hypothetical protein
MQRSRTTTAPTVSHTVTLDLIDSTGTATPIKAQLHYDPRDPYAVTTVFVTGGGRVRWTFARELLESGLHAPSGQGDVHVWPCLDADGRAVVIIELSAPDGQALVQANTVDLAAFVKRMNKAVAPGTESDRLDVDATIRAILECEPA